MKRNGETYNFGRVVYLTLIRRVSNSRVNQTWTAEQLERDDTITLCFDPTRESYNGKNTEFGQLNTRIDFYVKHIGDDGVVGENGFYATANIDVYNIGPALGEFLDAYNAYKSDGHFQGVNTKKYAAVLQVGYRGGERTTVFSGHISSFVMERQQSNSTIDNVWHFYCQYPDPQQNEAVSTSQKAYSGTDYVNIWVPDRDTYSSWEEFLRSAVANNFVRTVYTMQPVKEDIPSDSFAIGAGALTNDNSDQQRLLACPDNRLLALSDFDKYYRIKYQRSPNSEELPRVKQFWQQKVPVHSWNLNTASLQKTVNGIAHAVNCHAYIQLNEQTGIQTIYIYPAGYANIVSGDNSLALRPDSASYIIQDYQNLRKPPQVAANMIHFDMMMEPDMRPGDTIELRISSDFLRDHPHPTFEASYSMANTTTVFAGANFIGLASMGQQERRRDAIASAGNIFNTQYIVTVVEMKGSSHSAEWSTTADCYGVVIGNKQVTL